VGALQMKRKGHVRFMHDIYYLTGQIFLDSWSFVAIDFDEFGYITSDTFAASSRQGAVIFAVPCAGRHRSHAVDID
jgi:hypothetical protein